MAKKGFNKKLLFIPLAVLLVGGFFFFNSKPNTEFIEENESENELLAISRLDFCNVVDSESFDKGNQFTIFIHPTDNDPESSDMFTDEIFFEPNIPEEGNVDPRIQKWVLGSDYPEKHLDCGGGDSGFLPKENVTIDCKQGEFSDTSRYGFGFAEKLECANFNTNTEKIQSFNPSI